MSNNTTHQNDEYSKLYSLLNFRLPHHFKKIGIIGAISILTFLLASKFLGDPSLLVKDFLRTLILLFLLLASVSKEKIEDEYYKYIKSQSYVIAFVSAVSYAILLPLIALGFDIAITKISGDGLVNFHEVSAFEVLFILLCFQLLSYETLKRFNSAQ